MRGDSIIHSDDGCMSGDNARHSDGGVVECAVASLDRLSGKKSFHMNPESGIGIHALITN